MKKIPTLFQRIYKKNHKVGIESIPTPGCEKVLGGLCIPTVKYDGSCCAIIDNKLYKRYDCKKGRTAPEGAIPCCAPDPVTGHWPHWVKCDIREAADKWFFEAISNTVRDGAYVYDGTYEAVGPHFQGNPYNLNNDKLIRHGDYVIEELEGCTNFIELRNYLRDHKIEGIVWWDADGPVCKLKRTDFGYEWPIKEGAEE